MRDTGEVDNGGLPAADRIAPQGQQRRSPWQIRALPECVNAHPSKPRKRPALRRGLSTAGASRNAVGTNGAFLLESIDHFIQALLLDLGRGNPFGSS